MSNIPIPGSENPDIFSYGFDRSLNRDNASPIESNLVYDSIDQSQAQGITQSSFSGQSFENVNIGNKIITIDSTRSISEAFGALSQGGGGILNLRPGTYTVTTPLIGLYPVKILGESPTTTLIDFNFTASNLSFTGTGVYTTGTITAASGVSITGSGTTWLGNVSAGQHIFLGTRWYQIAAVTGNTSLVLAEAYGDNVTLPSTYRISSVMKNITVKDLLIKNSTGTGIAFTDCRQCVLDNIVLLTNGVGLSLTNCSEFTIDRVQCVASTSHGASMTNVGLCDWESFNLVGNGGSGLLMNNVKTASIFPTACDANTADGINMTTCVDISMLAEASGNGGQGIEFVSGCDNIQIFNALANGNTSDGIKLTATTDNVKIYGSKIAGNGGYGINIAAATCDNTTITTNTFAGNSSGAINDGGTSTTIRGNTGVDDSGTSFIAGQAITAGDAVVVGSAALFLSASNTTSGSQGMVPTTTLWIAQNFTTSSLAKKIDTVTLKFQNSSAACTLAISIRALDVSLVPTGADIDGQTASANTINGTTDVAFVFATPVNVSPSTSYAIVCRVTASAGSPDWLGQVGTNTDSTSVNSGSTWSGGTGARNHSVYEILTEAGKIYKADANVGGATPTEFTTGFVGFAQNTAASGAGVAVATGGIVTLSGLTTGSTYYLSNTAGSIGTSAGSVSVKVGRAVSTTKFLIIHDNA